ncbi:hypothetical protein [Chitinophaga barathri]|uniref:Uncharacterized protein n=1 Tax=Chitinophaga barathri TaxID=1647451 RepID=A0A3N4MCY6_9BACT|nr:hypothetical protein [Chitinophaga barathri]RPD41571.1 hypothetical protein EG028_09700 [Chitinophaga barathri]
MDKSTLHHYAQYALGLARISDDDADIPEALTHYGLKPYEIEEVLKYIAVEYAEVKYEQAKTYFRYAALVFGVLLPVNLILFWLIVHRPLEKGGFWRNVSSHLTIPVEFTLTIGILLAAIINFVICRKKLATIKQSYLP